MLFNSFDFAVFFIVVTSVYFVLPHSLRWMLMLSASCFFYMAFIPVYIIILLGTIIIDYFAGIWIEQADSRAKKRGFLTLSIISVCAMLCVFKYYNFFNANLAAIASLLHWRYSIAPLRMLLPIGLSFHTFQSLSYVIEVYRGRQRAERHFGIYALYVMYFPQLVAGPIERPQNLLHQFREPKRFDWARFSDGLSLMLWGLFKKVVVADGLALYVNAVYNSADRHNGTSLLLATYFFAFQIYCDFSGYSDIARGASRIYGIELMNNFDTPYFATSIREFWSRWHISLSTWFRDYVYIPLGGNRVSLPRYLFNVLFVFLLSGFWHGANWTFVVWGALHGTYLIIERLASFGWRYFSPGGETQQPGQIFCAVKLLITFHLVLFAWVFFRANSLSTACLILHEIAFDRGALFWDPAIMQSTLAAIMLLLAEVVIRNPNWWPKSDLFNLGLRTVCLVVLIFSVVLFGIDQGSQFIYFQF